MAYQPRIIDDELERLLRGLPAISVEGARGIGKTETSRRHARTTYQLDHPLTLEQVHARPDMLTQGEPPVLVDEWQRYEPSWDLIRRAVDEHNRPGSFLLTGSARPPRSQTHPGAGRIRIIDMRPMSLAERGVDVPTVSLGALLRGGTPTLGGGTDITFDDYVNEIVGSGFPGIRTLPPELRAGQLESYVANIVHHDLAAAGYGVRDPELFRQWLAAFADATATRTTHTKIARSATSVSGETPSRPTYEKYHTALTQLKITDVLKPWRPRTNPLGQLLVSPVHHLVDPALVPPLLGIDLEGLLAGEQGTFASDHEGTLVGRLFESLLVQSVRVYAQHAGATVWGLRTRDGNHEVDLIVQRRDGRVVAIEVKLSAAADADAIAHLHWLRRKLGTRLLDAIIITTGTHAFRRSDDIGVVPAALLGP